MKHAILVAVPCLAAVMACGAGAQTGEQSRSMNPLEQVVTLLENGDSFQAASWIEQQGTPREVAALYSQLVQSLYAKQRQITPMMLMGRLGIDYCLREGARLATDDPAQAEHLKGVAKTMAYNLAANAWPGWNEPGIEISRSDSLAALDAARLNLRLAGELNRNAEVHANAHWLLGAQHLALGQSEAALEQFAKAAGQFRQAEKPDFEQMTRGYAGIVQMVSDATREQGRQELAAAQAALEKIGSDDARFFVDQLKDVASYFVKSP